MIGKLLLKLINDDRRGNDVTGDLAAAVLFAVVVITLVFAFAMFVTVCVNWLGWFAVIPIGIVVYRTIAGLWRVAFAESKDDEHAKSS